MDDNKMKGYFAYWQDEIYSDFGDFLAVYSLPKGAEMHLGWHEAINEIMHEPFGVQMPKLVVYPKTGTIMPEYYLKKEETDKQRGEK